MADTPVDTSESDALATALEEQNAQTAAGNDAAGAPPITASLPPPESRGGGAAPAPDDGSFGAFSRGVANAVTFGFGDELGGVLDTLGLPDAAGTKYATIFNSNHSFAANLSANIAKERANLSSDWQNHTAASVAGNIGGSLLIPFGAGARGALQVAKVGAVQGAITGLGEGEDLEGRVKGAITGAAVGGVLGGALGKITEVGGRLLGIGAKDTAEVVAKDAAAGAERTGTDAGTSELVSAADTPTTAGPDGNSYATKLQDGQELLGFGRDNAPIYGRSDPLPSAPSAAEAAAEHPSISPEPHEDVPLTDPATNEQIGTMGKPQLAALQADVERFKAQAGPDGRGLDITQEQTPELASSVGEFRLGNLGNGEDTASLLRAVAGQLPPTLRRTDEDLVGSAKQIAGSLGEDPDAVLAWAKSVAGGVSDVDNTMLALRTVWAQGARQVNDIHLAGVDWANAGDDIVANAGQAIRNLTELSQQVQIAKSALGRGLRVNSLPDAETYGAELLGKDAVKAAAKETDGLVPVPPREVPPLPRDRSEMKDWFDMWGMTKGSPDAQSAFLQGRLTVPTAGKYLRTSFANFFTASILSAPKTVAMNVVGPTLVSTIRAAERFGGAAAQALNPLLTAEERASYAAVAKQVPSAYFGTFGDISDAFRQAMIAADNGASQITGHGLMADSLRSTGPLSDGMLNLAGADPNWKYRLGNMINIWPKAFSRVNAGLDELATRLSYQGEVRLNAQVEAATKGLTGDDFSAYVRQALQNSTDAAGKATDDAMLRSAQRTTMLAPVGDDGELGGWVQRFGAGVQGLRKDIPEMRYILPVFNVPANALGEVLRRLPIARMAGTSLDDALGGPAAFAFPETAKALAGELGPVAQAEAHGRFMLGASFVLGGLMMTRAGLMTGAGPQGPTDRKVWLQDHQPYSIRIGDEWVSYDKYDIAGGLLSIPATLADASVHRAADQPIGDMMMSGAGAMAQWFKDRAALRTATAILNAGSDPTQDFGSVMGRMAKGTMAGFVPNAFQSMATATTDPYIRYRRAWGDYLKATIPGLSEQLEPVRNTLGEPVQRSADTFLENALPVTMQPTVTYKSDPVLDEMHRLYQSSGYAAGADPKDIAGDGHFNPRDVKLEDGKSLYDHAMGLRQTYQIDGQTLRQKLLSTIQSPEYLNAVDAGSKTRETSLGDASRGYMIQRVFHDYNEGIKGQVANESALADRYLTAAAAKTRDAPYLQDVSAQDLVDTPHLYQDRGINAQAYSDKIRAGGGGHDALTAALGL